MSRIVRRTLIGAAIACIAALLTDAFVLLPPERTVGAGRLGDYVVHSAALKALNANVRATRLLGALHLHPVDSRNLSDQVALVTIDEEALDPKAGLGPFPFARSVYAGVVDKLTAAGAKAIAFDLIFTEPSRDPRADELFARSVRRSGRVVMPLLVNGRGNVAEFPIPPLQAAVARLGFTSTETLGGVLVAQPPLIAGHDPAGHAVEVANLGGAAAALASGKALALDRDGRARWDGKPIPLDDRSLLLLPISVTEFNDPDIRGGAALLEPALSETFSIAKIAKLSVRELTPFARGRLILIGPTAQALGDYIDTPTARIPGVFVNEMFAAQFLSGAFVRPAGKWRDGLAVVLLALLSGLLLMRLSLRAGLLSILGVMAAYGALNILLFAVKLYWIDLIHAEAAVVLATLGVAVYRIAVENREKKQLHTMFAGYLDAALVNDMMKLDDPTQALKLAGKRAKVTIFYSDIRSFTAISETMAAEEIYAQLNEYFEAMCEICFRYGGYPDKFIGDCLMAIFSAPLPREDDALRAVQMGLEQQATIARMSAAWIAQGRQPFTVGMGINTGEVVMGNLGSSKKMSYTVIGDNVNIAARLYNVAAGGQIIISEATYEEVKGEVIVNELQPIMVKGKSLPLRNFEVVGLRSDLPGRASHLWAGPQDAVWAGKH